MQVGLGALHTAHACLSARPNLDDSTMALIPIAYPARARRERSQSETHRYLSTTRGVYWTEKGARKLSAAGIVKDSSGSPESQNQASPSLTDGLAHEAVGDPTGKKKARTSHGDKVGDN